MKITAKSTFHKCDSLEISFSGCKPGLNIRRLRGPRARYCMDYEPGNNTHVCGCGFPLSSTNWELPAGWEMDYEDPIRECGPDGSDGRGYIRFVVVAARG